MKDENAPSDGASGGGADNSQHEQELPARRRRLRLMMTGGAIVAAVILAIWLIRHETYGKFQESTNDAFLQADSVTVAPRVAGYVDKVLVSENQDVKAGQPLVRIDARDYRAQAAQFEAQIALSAANAENARAAILEQEAGVAQARALLAAAENQARFAADEVARYQPLAETGAEPRERLATLRNQATQAAQDAAARRAALVSAQRRIDGLRAQVRQAEAQGQGARAQLNAAQVNVGSAVVQSSIAGRIGDLSARVGQFVQPGLRMMTIVPVQRIYLEANFKETQLGLMRPGQPATIHVDALPGVTLRGHVDSLAPGTGAQFSLLPPQNATGNFTKIVQRIPVRIAIDADPQLRRLLIPGLSAEVSVDTRSARAELKRLEARQEAYQGAGR